MRLAQDVGVLHTQSANELHIVTVFLDEKFFKGRDTHLFVILTKQERWLEPHQEAKLLLSEAELALQVGLKCLNLFNRHVDEFWGHVPGLQSRVPIAQKLDFESSLLSVAHDGLRAVNDDFGLRHLVLNCGREASLSEAGV